MEMKNEINQSLFPVCCMFVEVGNDSDNNYNLVHPRRKIRAVQEDFLMLVVSVQSRLSVVQKKIMSWGVSRKRMIFQTVDEPQTRARISCSLFLITSSELQKTGAARFYPSSLSPATLSRYTEAFKAAAEGSSTNTRCICYAPVSGKFPHYSSKLSDVK